MDNLPNTSTCHFGPSKQSKTNRKKRAQQKNNSLEKIRLVDGRLAYILYSPLGHILLQDLGRKIWPPNIFYFAGEEVNGKSS